MDGATTRTSGPNRPPRSRDREWFWRFLAVVMVVVVAWVVWIAFQISPPAVFLPAAYEAAAKARAANNAPGGSAADKAVARAQGAETSPHVPPHSLPSEPPVNIHKLKISDTIATPVAERPRREGKSLTEATK